MGSLEEETYFCPWLPSLKYLCAHTDTSPTEGMISMTENMFSDIHTTILLLWNIISYLGYYILPSGHSNTLTITNLSVGIQGWADPF